MLVRPTRRMYRKCVFPAETMCLFVRFLSSIEYTLLLSDVAVTYRWFLLFYVQFSDTENNFEKEVYEWHVQAIILLIQGQNVRLQCAVHINVNMKIQGHGMVLNSIIQDVKTVLGKQYVTIIGQNRYGARVINNHNVFLRPQNSLEDKNSLAAKWLFYPVRSPLGDNKS